MAAPSGRLQRRGSPAPAQLDARPQHPRRGRRSSSRSREGRRNRPSPSHPPWRLPSGARLSHAGRLSRSPPLPPPLTLQLGRGRSPPYDSSRRRERSPSLDRERRRRRDDNRAEASVSEKAAGRPASGGLRREPGRGRSPSRDRGRDDSRRWEGDRASDGGGGGRWRGASGRLRSRE